MKSELQTSFFCVEVNDLERGVVLQPCHIDYPIAVELEELLVLDRSQPKVDFHEILPHLEAHAVEIVPKLGLGGYNSQQDVLPQSVALALLESQHECAAVLVGRVLPHRLYPLLEKVDV